MTTCRNIFPGPEGSHPNYDEGKLVPCELPDLLSTSSGKKSLPLKNGLPVKGREY